LAHQVPFSVWGDNIFLITQSSIIMGQMWVYNKDIPQYQKVGFFSFFLTYAAILLSKGGQMIPPHIWPIILGTNAFLSK
jgi:hypothetical protein